MNRLVLAVTAIGVSALAVYAVTTSEDGEEIPEASVTQRSADPAPVLVALPQAVNAKKAMPTDFPSLAREIQRELKRVGCYDGEINARWTPATRAAMKAFVDDANARLPVDRPDQVLLSLVQGERGTACESCPAGQETGADGSCTATTVASGSQTVTGSIDRLAPATGEASSQENDRLAAAPAAPMREHAERDEPTPAPPAEEAAPYIAPDDPPAPAPVETAVLADPPPPSAEEAALMPPVAAPEQPKKYARYRNRPPKIVRKMIRSIQRGLASFGIR